MKYPILLYSILMSAYTCAAQKLKQDQFFLRRGLFDVQSGISVPIRDFALSNNTLPAGYAQNGYNIRAGINYDITPYLGFALQYQYTQNPINSDKLLADYRSAYPDLEYNSIQSDPWKLQGVLIGLYYPFKTSRTTVDVKILAGIMSGVYPEYIENVTVPALNNRNFNIKRYENSASNIGFEAGFKIRYQLYRQLILSTSIDYLQTKLDFENIRGVDTNSGIGFSADDYSQNFQIFNLSLGLGIQFD